MKTVSNLGPDFENSSWTTGTPAISLRETASANIRSFLSLLWSEPPPPQPLHRATVEGSCDAVWKRNGSCRAEDSRKTSATAQWPVSQVTPGTVLLEKALKSTGQTFKMKYWYYNKQALDNLDLSCILLSYLL